jgi:predicted alpha/beta-hydrolase family hydrolase
MTGAGAGHTSSFMVDFATGLAARGIDIVTFNFLYSEEGRRIPDPNERLEACWRAVIAAVSQRLTPGPGRLAIGGKSMGGRIASQVAAAGIGDLVGLVFLGYPLHPPGRPDRLRAKHLTEVRVPMLFVQGSRDPFGTPDELQPVIAQLDPQAELYAIEGGDHSFKVRKRSGARQEDVHRSIQDRIAAWLRDTVRTAR